MKVSMLVTALASAMALTACGTTKITQTEPKPVRQGFDIATMLHEYSLRNNDLHAAYGVMRFRCTDSDGAGRHFQCAGFQGDQTPVEGQQVQLLLRVTCDESYCTWISEGENW